MTNSNGLTLPLDALVYVQWLDGWHGGDGFATMIEGSHHYQVPASGLHTGCWPMVGSASQ